MDAIGVYSIPGIHEPVSCFTHLLAAPIFAVLGYFLVLRGRGNRIREASLVIMAVSSVFLLLMSGCYHLLEPGASRSIMCQLDVAAVFVLIAGTITPVHAILFQGFNRCVPLLLVWSVAATGITLRTVFPESLGPGMGIAIFLVLGWGGMISCFALWRRYGFSFVQPLLLGGVAYTLGAMVLRLHWPVLIPGVIGAHELWHFAVLLGLALHWKFVLQFAAGPLALNSEFRLDTPRETSDA